MDFEPSEHEPDEYDPEAEFRDPESDSLTIPEVEIPEVETTESEVPPELLQTFWIVVFVVNVAIFALALGVIVIVVWRDLLSGGALLLGSAVLFGLAVRRYRAYEPE